MKLRPLHDRVIVKRLEQETKTASGIVIPDNAAEKPDQGEVLAVGPGKRSDKGDFNTAVAAKMNISPEQRPWLFVVKKNKTVLERLLLWIRNRVANHVDPVPGRKLVTNLPLLVIDDESDHGSVDTGEDVVVDFGKHLSCFFLGCDALQRNEAMVADGPVPLEPLVQVHALVIACAAAWTSAVDRSECVELAIRKKMKVFLMILKSNENELTNHGGVDTDVGAKQPELFERNEVILFGRFHACYHFTIVLCKVGRIFEGADVAWAKRFEQVSDSVICSLLLQNMFG
jgi:hypothetical protein